jgi:uncharacterized protein (UPF0332 family)
MSDDTPSNAEFTLTVLRKAFELYFEPEIRMRQAAGTLSKPFPLWAAQIIMEPGKASIVNFNDQIVGVLQARPHAKTPLPIEMGQELTLGDLGDIVGMQLPGEFPNAGHLTAIAKDETWYLMFDFRYNAQRITQSVEVAEQFLQAAQKAVQDGHANAAIENLFAAVEIAAKGYLMIHPYEQLLRKHRHGFVASEFNRYGGKFGNVERKYVDLLNTLTNLRQDARYGTGPLAIPGERLVEWLQTTKAMLSDVMSRRATPYGRAS